MIKRFTSKTQALGEKGETAAVLFLKKAGYRILAQNVPNKFGEIDIVAQKDKTIFFFEVKSGRQGSAINPAENLHPEKIRRFLTSVEYYCLVNAISDYRVQGMVVLLAEGRESEVAIVELW